MAALGKEQIENRLQKTSGWGFSDNKIGKEFELKDFKEALSFVNKVGEHAEEMNHHPDIFIHSYNKVRIMITTHSEGGVTDKDFKLAEKVESSR